MKTQWRKWVGRVGALALAAGVGLTANAQAADKKFKIFLSMSYIGNDWQAEAANMVKAMAAHKDFATRSISRCRSPAPTRSGRSSRSTPWCSQGAKAIVVYPISPTALNQVVKNACDKGVMIIAYDAEITEPCAYNVTSTRRRPAASPRNGWPRSSAARATSSSSPACPAPRSTPQRTKAAKEVFAKYPDIQIVGEAVGMWSQAVARTELSKILATHNWDQIDGLWMQVGCYTANSMQIEAGMKPDDKLKPCAGEGSNGHRIQMLPAGTEVEGANGTYRADGRAAHLLRLAALFRRPRAEARGREARRQGHSEAHRAAAAARHQRDDQVLQGRHVGGNEGRLQRLPAVAGAESRLVRLDLFRPRRRRSACRRRSSASPSPDARADGAASVSSAAPLSHCRRHRS